MHGCVELMRSGEISRGLRMREHVRRIQIPSASVAGSGRCPALKRVPYDLLGAVRNVDNTCQRVCLISCVR